MEDCLWLPRWSIGCLERLLLRPRRGRKTRTRNRRGRRSAPSLSLFLSLALNDALKRSSSLTLPPSSPCLSSSRPQKPKVVKKTAKALPKQRPPKNAPPSNASASEEPETVAAGGGNEEEEDDDSKPQLMLAHKWDVDGSGVDPKGFWMSEKVSAHRVVFGRAEEGREEREERETRRRS